MVYVCVCVQLAGVAGTSVLLTQHERERLEELLKDLEEDQNNTDPSKVHAVKYGDFNDVEHQIALTSNVFLFLAHTTRHLRKCPHVINAL